MVDRFKRFSKAFKDVTTKYPAIFSGLIIYLYLLYCIIHYLFKARTAVPTFYDVLETFDALPFMWLLSVAMTKIIEVQERLHESEKQRILAQQQIDLKHTQLQTLHEVVKSMQHHINNPLAIIALALGPARRHAKDNPDVIKQLDTIDESTQRIVRTLKAFFDSESYQTERVGPVVGRITSLPPGQQVPPKNADRR